MNNLVIMPTEKRTLNLGEFAEEATIIVEETAKPNITFLEANTDSITLEELANKCGLTWNQPFHTKTLFLVCMKLQTHSMQVKR